MRYIIILFLLASISTLQAQDTQDRWVDSVYNAMSTKERIGQLIMIRAFSKKGDPDVAKVKKLIRDHKVGGICFFQGSPTRQASLINDYQSISKVPMLTAIDGEWGLGMRFKEKAFSFPRNLTLGAIQNNNYIYEMAQEIGNHCKRAGIHINFAPVVDVNNNPNNPVINDRSFGEDKYNVIAKSYAYMSGLQSAGVLACAKHFPGHGDTDVDSHLDLPVIHHSRERLDSVELVPFKAMISQGIASVMVAHLHIPSIDPRQHRPTTLSRTAVTEILREELAFNGLIFTDAMEMKGVTKHFKAGVADAEAFLAGADVILLPEDVEKAVNKIQQYIAEKKIPYSQLEASVKRILRTKYALGLHRDTRVQTAGLDAYVRRKEAQVINEKLIENAITLVQDRESLVPIQKLADRKFVTISIGGKANNRWQQTIKKYVDTRAYTLPHKIPLVEKNKILSSIGTQDVVIVGLHDFGKLSSNNHGIDDAAIAFIRELSRSHKVILSIFGSPYAVRYFEDVGSILVAYSDGARYQTVAAQALFGAIPIKGQLPVSPSYNIPYKTGLYRASLGRLGFSIPERVGLSETKLAVIDSLMDNMIKAKASPGAQLIVAKDNKIALMKSYGHHTYNRNARKVRNDDIYDVASVTKIAATTLSLMKLKDEGQLSLNEPISTYLPESRFSNKSGLHLDAILAHHAALKAWIPFYKSTVHERKKAPHPIDSIYARSFRDPYIIPVTDKLYLRKDYLDTVWTKIYDSDLRSKRSYKYSDLGMYLLARTIHNVTGYRIDEYAYNNFYRPLGLRRTGYLPLNKFDKSIIAPSEKDNYFRDQVVQGYVHDMGAAMLGGVSGHAGLFSNAYEIAIILQMILNGGSYGGEQYLQPETIRQFTTRYHGSTRRGLGFDMKELNQARTPNMSKKASKGTFGHLGFTGISAFADPEENLIFVMVANRTYPSMNNRTYIKKNYRPKAQTIVYESLMDNVNFP